MPTACADSSLASIDLDPGCAFVLLASEGDLAGVKHDAEAGVALESIDADGSTALTAAAHKGHVSVVEYLLRAGANTDAVEQRFGWTPLIAAAYGGHSRVVEALLGAGADTAVVDTYKGWTAFDHALEALARARTASSDSEDALAEREYVVCWLSALSAPPSCE